MDEPLNNRKQQIFHAIVKHFIQTATPVGSNTILINYNLSISPATIRNDMVELERLRLIYQPHTSAGRVPTDSGYRLYVNKLTDYQKAKEEAEKEILRIQGKYMMRTIKEHIYDTVAMLTDVVGNVSFATLPHQSRTFYLGLSKMLKQPEFREDSMKASQVVEVFEKDNNFLDTLHSLDIIDKVKIFIGEENIIEQIKSCSLIVTKYQLSRNEGFIGILGPTRMKYAYCAAALEKMKQLLENLSTNT